MHELGIVFHCIEQIRGIAAENGADRVSRVTIDLGEVSTVIPDLFRDVWNWAIKKEDLLRGCELDLQTIPAVTFCEDCGKTYPTVAHGRICPHCGSEKTFLRTGNEIIIREIEVTEGPQTPDGPERGEQNGDGA